MTKHYNIPVFIPEMACPHRCVFCNQETITGFDSAPSPSQVGEIVAQHLDTIKKKEAEKNDIRVAFFGGSFTGLPINIQEEYLKAVQPFFHKGVKGIRLSTRPDYIDEERLQLLANYRVTHIELGAQSMDDHVLRLSGRGHDAETVVEASKLIKEKGFVLGLQMMLGLPGDSFEGAMMTAKAIVKAGAQETRIYPTLVIKNTALERLWRKGSYTPLSLKEAVGMSAALHRFFEEKGVIILRTGLYPSEELKDGSGFLAGPFHPAFKELVLSEIWRQLLDEIPADSSCLILKVNPRALNNAVGYKKSNLRYLESKFSKVKFKTDSSLKNREFYVDFC